MNTIHKYHLFAGPGTTITHMIPEEAEVLCVMMQRGNPCLWVKVDEDKPLVPHTFVCLGTGMDFQEEVSYIASVNDEPYIWHFFEVL